MSTKSKNGPPKTKTKKNARKINPNSEFETPFKWIMEQPELTSNLEQLLPIKSWLLRHCCAPKHRSTFETQPLKFFTRACLYTVTAHQSKLSQDEMDLTWLRDLVAEYSTQLNDKKIDPEGLLYIVDAMTWYISGSGPLAQDFKSLSNSAHFTVNCVKLMFYSTAQFRLTTQKQFAAALVEDESCNFEVLHQYVRILRRCRHQKHNETLGREHLNPSHQEIVTINQALVLDESNYKIQITVCELLFDFVQFKVTQSWEPFKIGKQLYRTSEDIVKFLDAEIRRLLFLNSRSVRLNNLTTKFNISRSYREIFPTEKSRRFGFHQIDASIRLNSKSSSANYLIGLRDIHYGKYDEAFHHFKEAMENKPLSPKYTLAFVRSFLASYNVDLKLAKVPQLRKGIQEKIEFGNEHNWSTWNIQHLQFLNGCLTWISTGLKGAFQEWLDYYADSPSFAKQFRYLSPFGLKMLMLPATSVVKGTTLLQYCTQVRKSFPSQLQDFIKALTRIMVPKPKKPQIDLIIINKFYLKSLRPAYKMIKFSKKEETSLTSFHWTRLQEKRVIAEIDQRKLLANQAWYKKEIMPLNQRSSHKQKNLRQRAPFGKKEDKVIKKEKKPKNKELKIAKKSVDEFVGVRTAFNKKKSKQIFPHDLPVC